MDTVKLRERKGLLLLLPLLLLLLLIPIDSYATQAGDLIKLPNDGDLETTHDSAVYYVGSDGKRYVFPNSKVYFSWYANFDTVKEVSQSEISSLPIGGNVTYRPGTRLVKIISDPKVYAVEPGGVLRPIGSETVAKALYGNSWNKIIDDVPDAYFVNYTIGDTLSVSVYPTGSVVKRSSDGSIYYIDNGLKRHVSSMDVFNSLRLQDKHLVENSGSLSEYPDGDDVVAGESTITDTSGKNTVSSSLPPTFSLSSLNSSSIGVGSDASLFKLRVSSGTDVTLTRMAVKIDATTDGGTDTSPDDVTDPGDDDIGGLVYGNNAQGNLTDIRLVDASGNVIMGMKQPVLDITQDQSQTFVFSGTYRISAGQTYTLYLKAKVNSQLPEGQGYQATIPVSDIRVTDSSGVSASFLPTTDLAGPALTTAADKLSVNVAPTYSNNTYIIGAQKASIIGFTLNANSAGSNIVGAITFQGYIDEQEGNTTYVAGGDADNGTETKVRDMLTGVYLYDSDGELLAGPTAISLSGVVSFTGLSISIAPGGTKDIVVKGDISGTVDLENNANRITFDINDASTDIVAHDSAGGSILTEGMRPNGGTSPLAVMTVQDGGTLDFDFSGVSSSALAGTEVLFGTLRLESEDDTYTMETLTFINSSSTSASLGQMRLEYVDSAGATISKTQEWIGNNVTFSGLDAYVPVDATADIRLYGTLKPRDAGAVYNEVLNVNMNLSGPIVWSSGYSGSDFDEEDIGTADFPLIKSNQSSITVKYSSLTLALNASSPSGDVYRSVDGEEVMRFDLTAASTGAVRLKKISFKVTPGDTGTDGSDSDALENWADVNGDFADDDGVLNLKRVVLGGDDVTLAEGSDGRIRYSFAGDDTPAGRNSVSGDYGVISVEFAEGREFFIAAGSTVTFYLELRTSLFASFNNYPLTVQIMSGSDFQWTDVPSGTYTARDGGSVTGIGLQTPQLTVRL
jgi:hypothetical protein